jgi:hypothetical protein
VITKGNGKKAISMGKDFTTKVTMTSDKVLGRRINLFVDF